MKKPFFKNNMRSGDSGVGGNTMQGEYNTRILGDKRDIMEPE
jgi:hypothetical protein